MIDKPQGPQHNYRWTAYMKLVGETWLRSEKEILDEFEGFVQSLRGVGVDYKIVVAVEGGVPRQLSSECQTSEKTGKANQERDT